MRAKSLFALGAGIAVASVAILSTRRYRRWKHYQSQRLQAQSHLLETELGIVEYQQEGAGPVVLVLHGSPGGYDQGMALAHQLKLDGYTILSLSRPGYRRTPLISGQTPEAQADLCAAALDELHIEQVVVAAVSGGGPAALQFALRYPDRCQGLLLISALSQEYTEEGVYRSLPLAQRLPKRLLDQLIVWNPLLYVLSGLVRRIPEADQLNEFVGSLTLNSLHSAGYRNDMRYFEHLPVYPVQNIELPTLIVHGTADIDVPFRQSQELANKIPHAQLIANEGASHLSVLTGERTFSAIHTFLQQIFSQKDAHP